LEAEILSIGTELLLGEIPDTNAQYISSRLRDVGVNVYRRITVGDNPNRLTMAFEESIQRADIVMSTGGLGPTEDDVTAQCLAAALKRELVFSEDAWESIVRSLKARGRTPSQLDKKQAYIVNGGFFIPNSIGTAPGQGIVVDDKLIIILPGPPHEMQPMFENQVLPLIKERYPNLVPIKYVDLKVVGLPEAKVAEAISDLLKSQNPTVATYTGLGEVRVRIAATGQNQDESRSLIDQMEKEIRRRLKTHVYGRGDETLEEVVGRILRKRGLTLAVAESVTGGLICHRITEVPGSSRYFKMGMVAYHPDVKASNLGIPMESIQKDQAVNEETAKDMAQSIRLLAGADLGLSTTGFAGPEGGTENAPVGTVYIGLSSKQEELVEKILYPSSRSRVKAYAAQQGLYVLYKFLTQR